VVHIHLDCRGRFKGGVIRAATPLIKIINWNFSAIILTVQPGKNNKQPPLSENPRFAPGL